MKPITKKVIEFKKLILNLEGSERSTFFKDLNSYVYLYCEITEDKKKVFKFIPRF